MSGPIPYEKLINSSIAFPVVIGCSLFSIGWGILNVIMVSTHYAQKYFSPMDNMAAANFPIAKIEKLYFG